MRPHLTRIGSAPLSYIMFLLRVFHGDSELPPLLLLLLSLILAASARSSGLGAFDVCEFVRPLGRFTILHTPPRKINIVCNRFCLLQVKLLGAEDVSGQDVLDLENEVGQHAQTLSMTWAFSCRSSVMNEPVAHNHITSRKL